MLINYWKCTVTIKFVKITDPPPCLTRIHLHKELRKTVHWRTFKTESNCIPNFMDGKMFYSKVIYFWWIKTLLIHIFTFKIWVFFHSLTFPPKHLIFPHSRPFVINSSRSELYYLPLSTPEQNSQVQPHSCPGGLEGPHMKWPLLWSRLWHRTKKSITGTSLVAQWIRIHLSMQRTRVRALVQEDPTHRRTTKPVRHNYWACTLEPVSHNYWAHAPQLLKATSLEPVLQNKRSHRNEKPAHHNKE